MHVLFQLFILHRIYDSDICEDILKLSDNKKTRGHSLKLLAQQSRLDVRRFSFAVRVVKPWNSLPEEVVTAMFILLHVMPSLAISLQCNVHYTATVLLKSQFQLFRSFTPLARYAFRSFHSVRENISTLKNPLCYVCLVCLCLVRFSECVIIVIVVVYYYIAVFAISREKF